MFLAQGDVEDLGDTEEDQLDEMQAQLDAEHLVATRAAATVAALAKPRTKLAAHRAAVAGGGTKDTGVIRLTTNEGAVGAAAPPTPSAEQVGAQDAAAKAAAALAAAAGVGASG